ncbi:hypothetical protein Micbo1qcDRAFT_180251 [Microdochium bolleyi]|uniref:Uncharacterized protein n=1 Tax=Microdochium bolleyi TaxID=196109 RepID=A0A136IMH1_9PEZI|nr:hypothetical protein Micbo1qcDRAFT_180251 [Microdochium bolleyi]
MRLRETAAIVAIGLLDFTYSQQYILRYRFADNGLPQITSAAPLPSSSSTTRSSSSGDPATSSVSSSTSSSSTSMEFCSTVSSQIAAESEQAAASSFCSSYLSVPGSAVLTVTSTASGDPQTVTATSTTTELVTATVTASATGGQTASTETATTSSLETTSTVFVALTGCTFPTVTMKKRDNSPSAAAAPTPEALAGYAAGPALSSACSCLDIDGAPATTTTTTAVSASSAIVTVTEIVTQTTSVTVPAPDSTSASAPIGGTSTVRAVTVTTFRLVARAAPTLFYNGKRLRREGDAVAVNDPAATGDIFGLFPDGELRLASSSGSTVFSPGAYTKENAIGYQAFVLFGDEGTDETRIACSLAAGGGGDGTCPLTCANARGDESFTCDSLWNLGNVEDTQPRIDFCLVVDTVPTSIPGTTVRLVSCLQPPPHPAQTGLPRGKMDTTPEQRRPLSFLDLPVETRHQIYELYMLNHVRDAPDAIAKVGFIFNGHSIAFESSHQDIPPLMRTSKHVATELVTVASRHLRFVIGDHQSLVTDFGATLSPAVGISLPARCQTGADLLEIEWRLGAWDQIGVYDFAGAMAINVSAISAMLGGPAKFRALGISTIRYTLRPTGRLKHECSPHDPENDIHLLTEKCIKRVGRLRGLCPSLRTLELIGSFEKAWLDRLEEEARGLGVKVLRGHAHPSSPRHELCP